MRQYVVYAKVNRLTNRFRDIRLQIFRVWPWPLTPKGHLGSENFIPLKSPYMTSYLTSMDTISLSRTVSEIFEFKVFKVWPWPLTPKDHLGSKTFFSLKSPYMTSYMTSMSTISLSSTVSAIFDFKVFRVRPRPLTPKSHLESNNFVPLESPHMTSYLTSMDTIFLSRTVSEIFEFKVFRVWPWPLTPKGHLGSEISYHWKAHIWLPIWLLWTPSLYLVPFPRYSNSKFLGFDLDLWPLKIIWGQKHCFLLESLHMTSYLPSMDTMSLSRTVSEIFVFKVLGFDLDLWPLKIIWGQKIVYRWKAHIWLPIWLLWTPSLYLAPFSRYSTSKFLGFDLDLWPLKVIWGQKISYDWKAHIWLPIRLLWTLSLYLVPFSRKFGSQFFGSNKMADFDLFKVKVIDRYFSLL